MTFTHSSPDMTTQEIADRLVSLCREGRNEEAKNELYSNDIVSVEVNEPMKVVRGLEATRAKGAWWEANHEVHSAKIEGPFVNDDQFAVRFTYDITPKATGNRVAMDEVALYDVKDGKIIKETFLY